MFDNCGKWFSHNFFKTVPFICCRCKQLLSFLYLRTSKTLSLKVFDECKTLLGQSKTLLGQSKTLLRQSSVPCFVATNSGFVVTKFVFAFVATKSGLVATKVDKVLLLPLLQPRIKISVNTDISVIGFYGNIGNIGKYRWIF